MITGDLRRAIGRAAKDAGLVGAAASAEPDPGLRPGGAPGRYSSSVAFALAAGSAPRAVARLLATRLAEEPWLASAEVSGPGFLALTVTAQALAELPERIAAAGQDCVRSDALRGVTLEAPPAPPPASGWEEARKALAAELTVRLAAAAGATVTAFPYPERTPPTPHRNPPADSPCPERTPPAPHRNPPADSPCPERTPPASHPGPPADSPYPAPTRPTPHLSPPAVSGEVAAAVAYAGPDAVRFWLARAVPGRPVRLDAAIMARHVPDNPAYAVRYAHARAASGVRWAAARGAEAVPRRRSADPGELALLDALSWLPERVAVAARRRRPDEFARYLEELASVTVATLSSAGDPGSARAPGSDRLALASAAQAGLAAGLGLLGVSAPDRL